MYFLKKFNVVEIFLNIRLNKKVQIKENPATLVNKTDFTLQNFIF